MDVEDPAPIGGGNIALKADNVSRGSLRETMKEKILTRKQGRRN